jgi:hypothetical protein
MAIHNLKAHYNCIASHRRHDVRDELIPSHYFFMSMTGMGEGLVPYHTR